MLLAFTGRIDPALAALTTLTTLSAGTTAPAADCVDGHHHRRSRRGDPGWRVPANLVGAGLGIVIIGLCRIGLDGTPRDDVGHLDRGGLITDLELAGVEDRRDQLRLLQGVVIWHVDGCGDSAQLIERLLLEFGSRGHLVPFVPSGFLRPESAA